MTNYKLAYIEHISQLLNYKLLKAHHLLDDAQHELESIQWTSFETASDLSKLSC